MNKAKILASLLGTASIALGTSFVPDAAQAATFVENDFFILDVNFQAELNPDFPETGLATLVSIGNRNADGTPDGTFVAPGTAAMPMYGDMVVTTARVNGTALTLPPSPGAPLIGELASFALNDGDSFRLTDGFMGPDFPDNTPPNSDFPDAVNAFRVLDPSSARPFWTVTLPDSGDPTTSGDVAFELSFFEITQTTALTPGGLTGFEFNGKGRLFSDGSAPADAEFGAALVFNPDSGAWEADGGLTVVVTSIQVPEPGTILGLLALGGLGLGAKLKKQS